MQFPSPWWRFNSTPRAHFGPFAPSSQEHSCSALTKVLTSFIISAVVYLIDGTVEGGPQGLVGVAENTAAAGFLRVLPIDVPNANCLSSFF
mmetsp:Transcript_58886/g.80379  ORF Transcript_58886/g.80379 Transcript_58886/m.80379 type:complete len:91 (+) Transcript_58886:309-581(+)